MPEARQIGNVAGRTIEDLLTVQEDSSDLLAIALEDLTDGDNDTRRAETAIVRAVLNTAGTAGVLSELRRGNMRNAEARAMQLAMRSRRRKL